MLVTVGSKSVFICNCFHARLLDSSSSKIAHFERMPKFAPPRTTCGIYEPGPKSKQLKYTFWPNAENFIHRLSFCCIVGICLYPLQT